MMKEQSLLSRSEAQFRYSNIGPKTTCECYVCGACVWCIVFAPITGMILAPALGGGLVQVRD